ncbi:MAG: DUF4349 domain-containing protein [Spirulinaceae cyanobacterium]
MKPATSPKFLFSALLASMLLVSCGSAGEMAEQVEGDAATGVTESTVADEAQEGNTNQPKEAPQTAPQLAKTAEMALEVKSIEEALDSASDITKRLKGDVLGLENSQPQSFGSRHQALMKIRVPQANLEPTLDALRELGTLESESINAEDVSNQLVDVKARLRNLRQTENSLLKIMDRSGSMGDTLQVAKELSNIRSSIEQIDAQLKNLTNRVAYSTITLNLTASVASDSQPPVGSQMQKAWSNATQSFQGLTMGLLRLGIWLAVHSPYLLVLGAAIFFWRVRSKKKSV